jgi:hypothetical protein
MDRDAVQEWVALLEMASEQLAHSGMAEGWREKLGEGSCENIFGAAFETFVQQQTEVGQDKAAYVETEEFGRVANAHLQTHVGL